MTVFCPPYSDRIAPAWYWASLGGSLCVLALAIWLSSGTMAPYAATLDEPRILEPCGYLANIDYDTLRAPFLMLDGRPALYWDFSVVLRRVGFPLLAYPLMKLAGYDVGGFVASLLLNLAAVLWFSVFVRRAYGDRSAIVTHWILATYPGIPYWAGLPYCYTAIVPSCLVCAILLAKLEHAAEYAHVLLLALGIGTTFIAYDLLPFFVPAGVLILLLRPDLVGRRLRTLTVFCCAAILPTIISNLALKLFFGARLLNDNTSIYYNIIGAYYGLAAGLLHLPRWPTLRQPVMPSELAGLGWGELLSRGPRIFIEDYLFGNFLFLPIFVLALGSVLALSGMAAAWSVEPPFVSAVDRLLPAFHRWPYRDGPQGARSPLVAGSGRGRGVPLRGQRQCRLWSDSRQHGRRHHRPALLQARGGRHRASKERQALRAPADRLLRHTR
jgi:hypothetical protein